MALSTEIILSNGSSVDRRHLPWEFPKIKILILFSIFFQILTFSSLIQIPQARKKRKFSTFYYTESNTLLLLEAVL